MSAMHGDYNGWCRVAGLPVKAKDCPECVAVACSCEQSDWYHDGLPTYSEGRLCRACGKREGYNPRHDRYDRVGI